MADNPVALAAQFRAGLIDEREYRRRMLALLPPKPPISDAEKKERLIRVMERQVQRRPHK
jgi:hypothetical protein